MSKVYFISGLGADKRVFSFLDLSFCEPVFMDWISPVKNESLKEYAIRLREKITDDSPVIVGISFGGMLVTEMAKSDSRIKGILISSNKTSSELPGKLKLGKYLPVYKWMPGWLLKRVMLSAKWVLGAKGKEQRKMLAQIIRDADIPFSKWAIGAILNWKSLEIPRNIVLIHGRKDRLLPYSRVQADYTIEKGGHTLPMDEHLEISALLKQLI